MGFCISLSLFPKVVISGYLLSFFFFKKKLVFAKIPGVLPYKKLMGICRWMGSHFRGWIDYNGIAFSVEFLEWGRTFSDFLG